LNRRLLLGFGVSSVACSSLAILLAQTTPTKSTAADFERSVLPVLARNCFTCHNEKLKTANLNLEAFRDFSLAPQHPEIWEKVLNKLQAGQMPPSPMPAPPKEDVAAVTRWIEALLGASLGATPDPGRVTARRLNRVEYNHTIRDLLGVSIRPADEFPTDDSGYGFDNIGDVLSLSPLLLEKYLNAARRVSRIAVFGESYEPKPALIAKLMPKKFQDDSPATGNILPFSMRGALFGSFHFPVTAEYEFQLRFANYRPDPPRRRGAASAPPQPVSSGDSPGSNADRPATGVARRPVTREDRAAQDERARQAAPPIRWVFTIDGKPALTDVIEGTTSYQYSRGEFTVRLRITAGDHYLRVSFPEFANLADPRTNLNPDGRRQLYIDYMNIVGPWNPEPAPPDSYSRVFVCGHQPGHHNPQCGPRIIADLVHRAYRRPPTSQETDGLLKLVAMVQQQGDSFEEGIRVALQAVLLSPNFLFRVERDPVPSQRTWNISDHELASRLSYFLWSTMPDDELLRTADEHRLRQPGVLNSEVHRMLRDPRSRGLVDNFAGQWLNLRLLDRKKPDPARFPTVDDELLDAMRHETELFVETILREDRSVLDFIDGRFTFVNGMLARHYGLPGIDGEAFQRVELSGEQRSGLVTQGSILTLSSYATRTSPVIRGKWVLENLLGTPPPPPPPDVPPLEEANLGTKASLRERLQQHRANPSCAACHNQMDPIGFGLENYDAAGAWRTKDGNFDVDSTGTLPDGRSFTGAKGLKEILYSQKDLFVHNLTEKLLTYALGRGLERADGMVVNRISREVAAREYRFSALVEAIVNSEPFQMRKGLAQ
jgi:mono/diheme cytochrome c family protein